MNIRKLLAISTIMAIISGCEAPADTNTNTNTINSVSGTIAFSELFTEAPETCVTTGLAPDLSFASTAYTSNGVTTTRKEFDSTDDSCSGLLTATYVTTQKLVNNGSISASWSGGTPPTLADSSGPMEMTINASKLTLTVESSDDPLMTVGSVNKNIMFVDDTDATLVPYIGDDAGGTSADGYPLLLLP